MTKEVWNSVTIVGNLGADPDIRFFESGACRCEIRIAVYSGKDKSTGEAKPPYWFSVKAFGDTAQQMANTLRKGDRIKVTEGQLAQDSWTDRQSGNQRTKDYVLAWAFEKVERRPAENNTGFNSYDDTF